MTNHIEWTLDIGISCDVAVNLLTSDEHHQYGEYLFGICIWSNIAKPDTCQTTEGEVECGHILGLHVK